ncbi:MAG: ABC transporter permease [Rhodobacteraceae bacterium]|nr:ABC transporter permease [Paracoccaceae bacterium]MCP5342969.1 ABC transporter permease [Paracoccaceae bacterium]
MANLPENATLRRSLALGPAVLIVGAFMLVPVAIMGVYSFLEAKSFGGVTWSFSGDAYVQLFYERLLDDSLRLSSGYLIIIARSFFLALVATVSCLIVGFPVAWFIARRPLGQRNMWILLITIPFWTNQLVRTFAWIIILGRNGVIEAPFRWAGLLGEGETLGLMYSDFAIAVGLTYTFIPLMVLPIYASLEKLDFSLVEAGADLYSSRWETFSRIVIPLSKPGIVAGCLLVFIPSLGAFIQPDLLGGGKKLMLGTLVQFQFSTARNWPFGSAIAMILLAFVIAFLMLYARAARGAKAMEMRR